MCVAQFRDYCSASKFKINYNNQYEKDLNNKDIIVGQYFVYEGKPDAYYVTDLKKMKELAKNNNPYAIDFIYEKK